MSGRERESCAPHTPDSSHADQVRKLNNALWRNLQTGIITATPDIRAMGSVAIAHILRQIVEFDDFTSDNDPYGEHDMGVMRKGGAKLFWQIDYYDHALEGGVARPSRCRTNQTRDHGRHRHALAH